MIRPPRRSSVAATELTVGSEDVRFAQAERSSGRDAHDGRGGGGEHSQRAPEGVAYATGARFGV